MIPRMGMAGISSLDLLAPDALLHGHCVVQIIVYCARHQLTSSISSKHFTALQHGQTRRESDGYPSVTIEQCNFAPI